jgi:hypothetical protein
MIYKNQMLKKQTQFKPNYSDLSRLKAVCFSLFLRPGYNLIIQILVILG